MTERYGEQTFLTDKNAIAEETRLHAKTILANALSQERHLLEPEAYCLLQACGVCIPEYRFATTLNDAKQAFELLPKPLVMKIVSRDILHKSDVGGVRLGVSTADQCAAVWREFQRITASVQAAFEGALLVTEAKGGFEAIVGAFRDEEFGPVVMVGPGGILVEILREPTFFTSPVESSYVSSVVSTTTLGRILSGVRGQKSLDVHALSDLVSTLSNLIVEFQEIKEIDLNPVVVYGTGIAVLDARILLEL